jgi:hypothetical protein
LRQDPARFHKIPLQFWEITIPKADRLPLHYSHPFHLKSRYSRGYAIGRIGTPLGYVTKVVMLDSGAAGDESRSDGRIAM